MKYSKNILGILLLVLAVSQVTASEGSLGWSPAKQPVGFGENLTELSFLQKLQISQKKQIPNPELGWKWIEVRMAEPGGSGFLNGIRSGARIVSFDGTVIHDISEWDKHRTNVPQTIAWLDPDGGAHQAVFQPGLLRIARIERYRPLLQLLLQTTHDAAYNAYFRALMTITPGDPDDLGMPVLAKLDALGYPDKTYLHRLATIILAERGRSEDALAHADNAGTVDEEVWLPYVFIAAVRAGRPAYALELLAKKPAILGKYAYMKPTLTSMVTTWGDQPRPKDIFLEMADWYHPDLVLRSYEMAPILQGVYDDLITFGSSKFWIQTNHFYGFVLTPAQTSLWIHARITLKATEVEMAKFAEVADISLVHQTASIGSLHDPSFIERPVVRLNVESDGRMFLGCVGYELLEILGELDAHLLQTEGVGLDIAVHHGWCSFKVAGRAIYDGPLPTTAPLAVQSHFQGLSVRLAGVFAGAVPPADQADAVKRDNLVKGRNAVTYLMRAACCGDVASVRHLLAGKPDLDSQDVNGQTALHHAARGNWSEVVKLLCDAGARQDIRDTKGRLAQDLSSEGAKSGEAPAPVLPRNDF